MVTSSQWLAPLFNYFLGLVYFSSSGFTRTSFGFFFTSKPAAPEIPPSATTFPAVTKAVMRGAQDNNPLFVSYFISLVFNELFVCSSQTITYTHTCSSFYRRGCSEIVVRIRARICQILGCEISDMCHPRFASLSKIYLKLVHRKPLHVGSKFCPKWCKQSDTCSFLKKNFEIVPPLNQCSICS